MRRLDGRRRCRLRRLLLQYSSIRTPPAPCASPDVELLGCRLALPAGGRLAAWRGCTTGWFPAMPHPDAVLAEDFRHLGHGNGPVPGDLLGGHAVLDVSGDDRLVVDLGAFTMEARYTVELSQGRCEDARRCLERPVLPPS